MVDGRPQLAELQIADPPARWEALGFAVQDSTLDVGGVRLALGRPGRGLTGWTLRDDRPGLTERLGEHVSPIKAAVQSGRHITTLRRSAGLGLKVAFMDPAP